MSHTSEDDVKEAARALTGWTIVNGQFGFREARHDDGEKSFFGKHGQLTGDDLLECLIEQPATSRRLAWRICHTFMGEGVVDEPALTELADGLQSHELDVGWAVETVLRSQLFFAQENLRTRVVGPVAYVVGALQALQLVEPPPSTLLLAEWTAQMGQDLFNPPNVGGWNEGRAWLGSRTLIARANFASALVEGRLWHPIREPDLAGLLRQHGVNAEPVEGANWLATLLWGEAPATVVENVVAQAKASNSENPLLTVVAQLMARPEHYLG